MISYVHCNQNKNKNGTIYHLSPVILTNPLPYFLVDLSLSDLITSWSWTPIFFCHISKSSTPPKKKQEKKKKHKITFWWSFPIISGSFTKCFWMDTWLEESFSVSKVPRPQIEVLILLVKTTSIACLVLFQMWVIYLFYSLAP